MSTILDAIRERDGDQGQAVARPDGSRTARWWLPLAVLVSGSVVVGVARRPSPSPAGPVVSPVTLAAPPAAGADIPAGPPAAGPGAHASAPARIVAVEEPPRARVDRWRPAPPSAETPAASNIAVAPAPAEDVPVAQPPAPGVPSVVRLEGIHHAEAPAERSVMLAIDGAAPVRLRQGDAVGGIEVQLILPGAVYVRRGGDIFAVGDVR